MSVGRETGIHGSGFVIGNESMDQPTTSIRVLLVDDGSLLGQAIGGALDREQDLEVVAQFQTPNLAVRASGRLQPDVLVVDGNLLKSRLGSFITAIHRAAPRCRVLILSSDEQVHPLIDALRAGATGYLTMDSSFEGLVAAARAVARDEVVVPPQMLGRLLNTLIDGGGRNNESIRTLSKLTRRECQVLSLLADGLDKEAIARALAISPQTARTHIQNILAKLGLHSRLEAAAFARKHPILQELVAAE